MSRARKVKKANRYFEYETTDYLGEVVMWSGGEATERESRISRMIDKQHERTGYGILDAARGVKYHVPHGSYVQYKGRKQLPRDYYSRR